MNTRKAADMGGENEKKGDAKGDAKSDAVRIRELEALVEDLYGAAILGQGFDNAVVQAMREKKRVPVQFLANYGRAPVQSPHNYKLTLVEGYQARAGQIAMIDEREVERLRGVRVVRHVPGRNGRKGTVEMLPVIEADPKKFTPMKVTTFKPGVDENGHFAHVEHVTEVPVEDLIRRAEALG